MAPDRGLRRIGDGTVLVGGSPIRLLRLTPAGRDLVARLTAGEPVPPTAAAQSLTRRLLDAGLAHPRPPAPTSPPEVAVVIPVRDDPTGLAATLAAVAREGGAPEPTSTGRAAEIQPAPNVVVVDDASSEPGLLIAGCAAPGTALIRRRTCGGPGVARNDGWRSTAGEFVAFVDANCEPEPGWLEVLLPQFADPQVAAAAPRIVPAAGPAAPRWLAAYEAVSSPLDLGAREAIVRPRSPVAYVPTAALVVRRTALEALGGFDETLTVGEDVDFVWRLVAAGWTVRYEPRATVRHPIRPRWKAWLAQRYRYGTSAAPLARRHGSAVAPVAVSPWTAAAWTLVAAGQPVLGAAAAGYSVAALTGRLSHRCAAVPYPDAVRHPAPNAGQRRGGEAPTLPLGEALRLGGLGHLRGGLALARAVRRAWAPAAVLLAVASRRSRPALAAAVVVPGLLEWLQQRPRLDPARFLALRLADEFAYAAGVWAGCARERSVRALSPDLRSARRPPVGQTDEPLSGSIGGRG
ncbi:MAG TPA: mycofactocin biosynthesis glycosyltransferase MftF [Acidimicrobiia bacterium]|nr:mycofactocin biosynthesis glycosyltransferase MftF [Acidimicrobiia bacterium]